MFLFLRLILAHFLADFPFQPDVIYKLKVKNIWGQLLHMAIFAACAIVFCWPFLGMRSIWILILFLGISHLTVDCLKVRYFNNRKRYGLGAFLVDQVLHLAAISVIFLTGLKELSFSPQSSFIIGRLYANDTLILLLIAGIIVVFVINRIRILRRSL